jgi:tetratricopeptide (TPR) repeat protein
LTELAKEGAATPNEVLAAYDAALALDPLNPSVLADAGHAAWSLGQHARARELLRRGAELDPEQANLRALGGLVAMAEGHYEEAEVHFDAAARRDWHGNDDGQLQALTIWAACLVKLHRPHPAEFLTRHVLERRPDWPGPRYTLAYALTMLGRFQESAECYRELIRRCPDHPLAAEARKKIGG